MNWSSEEDELLRVWQSKLGNKWAQIAKHVPGRTGQQCAQRWRHKGNPEIRKEKWSEEEDNKLRALYAEHGNSWAHIARQIPGRTDQQCMGRWRRHLDPTIHFGAWTAVEDRKLEALASEHGSQWSRIAGSFGNRTAQQCRARWVALSLDPVNSLMEKKTEQGVTNQNDGLRKMKKAARKPMRGDENAILILDDCSKSDEVKRRKLSGSCSSQQKGKLERSKAKNVDSQANSPKLPCDVHVPRRPRGYPGKPLSQRQMSSQPGISAAVVQPPLPSDTSQQGKMVPAQAYRGRELKISRQCDAGDTIAFPWLDTKQKKETALYVDALFFWLQLLLLRPLQPVTTGVDGSLKERMRHLMTLGSITFLLYCCPRIAMPRSRSITV